jgi:hypothetical protein
MIFGNPIGRYPGVERVQLNERRLPHLTLLKWDLLKGSGDTLWAKGEEEHERVCYAGAGGLTFPFSTGILAAAAYIHGTGTEKNGTRSKP